MKVYVPAYIDHYQSVWYRHVATEIHDEGSLVSVFADGHRSPSCYATESAMLEAARTDYRERVRLVQS